MNLQEIGSRAFRAAIQENRVSFQGQAPAFRKHSRAEIQWRMSVLYFVQGWSIRALADRYNLCEARVQQLMSSWRRYAISANYIQEIPPEGAQEILVPESASAGETQEPQPRPSGPVSIEFRAHNTPDRNAEEPAGSPDPHVSRPPRIHIPRAIASYYEHPRLFGLEVSRRFPSAKFDIREAGSCFALGRNTACVFHVERAAQVALRCLCQHLGCAPYLESLPAMIDQAQSFLLDEIEGKSIGESGLEYNTVALAALKAFQESLENTYPGPAGAYDAPRAQLALETARVLMQHLALRLCEQGVIPGFTQAS